MNNYETVEQWEKRTGLTLGEDVSVYIFRSGVPMWHRMPYWIFLKTYKKDGYKAVVANPTNNPCCPPDDFKIGEDK